MLIAIALFVDFGWSLSPPEDDEDCKSKDEEDNEARHTNHNAYDLASAEAIRVGGTSCAALRR